MKKYISTIAVAAFVGALSAGAAFSASAAPLVCPSPAFLTNILKTQGPQGLNKVVDPVSGLTWIASRDFADNSGSFDVFQNVTVPAKSQNREMQNINCFYLGNTGGTNGVKRVSVISYAGDTTFTGVVGSWYNIPEAGVSYCNASDITACSFEKDQ